MKNLKLGISVLALTIASSVFAQTTNNPWLIGVGAHGVNHVAVKGNDFGGTLTNFKQVFNMNNYTITPPLSKLTVARNLNKYLVLDWQTTVGNVDNKRFGMGKEFMLMTGLGLQLKANVYQNEELMTFFNKNNSKANIQDKFDETIDDELLNFIDGKLSLYNKLTDDRVNKEFKRLWFNEVYDRVLRGV